MGILAPQKSKKASKVGFVVKGITCKLIPLCQRPSMCDSLVSLTIHSWRQPQTKNRPYLWLHGSKTRFRGHLIHLQSPTFCGFHPSELPKRTPTPPYLGPVGCGKLLAQTETGGCPNGSSGSNRGKKLTFLKNDPRPCVILKQVFWTVLSLWWPIFFGPLKMPKCLENGLFWDQKGVKNGSKTHFSKTHPRPFGVHKRVK